MPRPPLTREIDEFLRRPNPAVIATVRADGSPHTAATWYLWDGRRALVNMDESRLRLRFMRHDPRVSLTALGEDAWYRHATLVGRVVGLGDDDGLEDIDRLALHYTGSPFRNRERRRVSAWIEPEYWHAWDDAGPWPREE